MATLAEIRAKLKASEQKGSGERTGGDNSIYPFWNLKEGGESSFRFLPDGNESNTFFWVERAMIKLPFNGVVGETDNRQVTVQVPCVEMYNDGSTCPILAEVRPWYKDESLKEQANKYWKKRSYLFQGFVRQNPLGDDKEPANPIRRFVISSQIFNVIKSSLMDPEMEELPTDYVNGVDFNIRKTSKGNYADYSTSNWSRKISPLTEAEQAAIEAHGLFNLTDFLPKKPGEAELRIIKEMFDASVNGEEYDLDRWGAYYRPFGLEAPANSAEKPVAEAQSTPAPQASRPAWEDDEPQSSSQPIQVPKNAGGDKAQDILAMIRARQNKSA